MQIQAFENLYCVILPIVKVFFVFLNIQKAMNNH